MTPTENFKKMFDSQTNRQMFNTITGKKAEDDTSAYISFLNFLTTQIVYDKIIENNFNSQEISHNLLKIDDKIESLLTKH